ncbi:MAG TPA: hypothetical protein VIP11_25535 [Gemmatimonadaceae bacterium]
MSRGFIFLAALALASPSFPSSSLAQVTQQGQTTVQVKNLSETLGLKPAASGAPTNLELGSTVTFTLADPAKLAKFTVRGMHEGARVTVTRVAPDRIRVEADEMEPVALSGKVTLKVNLDGTMTVVPDAQRRPPTG